MTPKEVAEYYRVSQRTVTRWIRNGQLKAEYLPTGQKQPRGKGRPTKKKTQTLRGARILRADVMALAQSEPHTEETEVEV